MIKLSAKKILIINEKDGKAGIFLFSLLNGIS